MDGKCRRKVFSNFPWYYDRRKFFKCLTPTSPLALLSYFHSRRRRRRLSYRHLFVVVVASFTLHKIKKYTLAHLISDPSVVCEQKPFGQHKISVVKIESICMMAVCSNILRKILVWGMYSALHAACKISQPIKVTTDTIMWAEKIVWPYRNCCVATFLFHII